MLGENQLHAYSVYSPDGPWHDGVDSFSGEKLWTTAKAPQSEEPRTRLQNRFIISPI